MWNLERDELQQRIQSLERENLSRGSTIDNSSQEISKLKVKVKSLEIELLGTREAFSQKELLLREMEQAWNLAAGELHELKEAIIRTVIKLPGGNEVTLEEARGMVLTHEKIHGT